jgi:broad specificity phosphatase PhoE
MSTQPTKIYLVRHGESVFNRQGLFSGQVDPELTDKGREQVLATRRALKHVRFDVAYSSNLIRAIETGEIIYGEPIPARHRLRGLRERSFGSLEGTPEHPVKDKVMLWPELPGDESWHYRLVPDMETDHEVSQRFIPVLKEIAQAHPGKTILIAAHGGVIRTAIMKLKGLTLKQMPPRSFQNGGYAILTYNDTAGLKVQSVKSVVKE